MKVKPHPLTRLAAALCAGAALAAAPSARAESIPAAKCSLWCRDDGAGTLTRDGGAYCVRHTGERDWCLNLFHPLAARPGDEFALSCASAPLDGGPADGTFELCVTLFAADGRVVDWTFARTVAAPGASPVCRFMVPPGVATVEPRIIGYRPVGVRISGVSLARTGNRIAGAALPQVLAAESATVRVEVDTATGAMALVDRRNGRRTSGVPVRGGYVAVSAKSGPGWAECELVNPETLASFTARFEAADRPGEAVVTLSGEGELARPLDYPLPLETRKGERLIVPENEGMGFPVDEEHPELWRLVAYGGHGICMAFFGACEDATGAGWMCILETPDDAAMGTFRNPAGRLWLAGPSWDAQRGRFGYARRVRYALLEGGGHVAMARRYREYAAAAGRLVTFREKAKARPAIDKLLGAANVWCWWYPPAKPLATLRDMQAAGLDHILWSADGTPEFLAAVKDDPGVIAGRYDIYQDIMDPANRDRMAWWHRDWVDEAFDRDINWAGPSRDQWRRGWPVDSKDGTRISCAVICDRQALPYARRRIGGELKTRAYQSRFIDTTTASPWFECWNPDHPMTRTDSRVWKMKLLEMVSKDFGLVCGCETGHDASVPYCDYFEGMLSIGPYRIDEAGRDMRRIVDEVPARTAKYQVGERYRLPLWELVYHDCTVAQWYWGDYSNKLPGIWRRRDLFNALYGTPPMYMLGIEEWPKYRDRIAASYRLAEPVSRLTAYAAMTDHEFLAPDRSVQRTRFSNGVTVTVNFGSVPHRLGDGSELAPESARWSTP